jgi:hypothetical protein
MKKNEEHITSLFEGDSNLRLYIDEKMAAVEMRFHKMDE